MPTHEHKKFHGNTLILIASIIAIIISCVNFFSSSSPIRHTGGAELVIITAICLLGLSLVMLNFRHLHKRWERVSVYIVMLILILGSMFAAWLLQSWWLLLMFTVMLLGWLLQLLTK